ncbi:MAG: hypothetical protein KVP17_002930 [Porospora cf. gigantea B]|nr:MAG: hypothetical protein KVP17_002930 [Porospora cf. gigantea B]
MVGGAARQTWSGFYIDAGSLQEMLLQVNDYMARGNPGSNEIPRDRFKAILPPMECINGLTSVKHTRLMWEREGLVTLPSNVDRASTLTPVEALSSCKDVTEAFSNRLDFEINKAAVFYDEILQFVVSEVLNVRNKWAYLSPTTLPQVYEQLRGAAELLADSVRFVDENNCAVEALLKQADELLSKHETFLDKENFLKSRLRPDAASALASLRIHDGLGGVAHEIQERLSHMRKLENSWLHSGEISKDSVRRLHRRKNTLKLLENITLGSKRTLRNHNWFYGLEHQAQIDYEKEPVGQATFFGLFINNFNTFLYMANYYVVIPTAAEYAQAVGMSPTVSGLLLAMTPLSALLSSIVYSLWSNFSFRQPLIFCTFLMMMGNLLYAMALEWDDKWWLFWGRLLVGLGGNRAVNRRYIADFVSVDSRTMHSVIFVAVGSLGMSAGPGLQVLFNKLPETRINGHIINSLTLPGWSMFFLWVLFLIAAIVLFVEPQRRYALRSPGRDIMRPLLNETNSFTRAAPIQTNHKLTDADGTVVCLWIYFVLKLVQEGFQTAAPLYAAAQFGWTDGDVGGLLAVIGIIVLPTNLFVGWISNRVSDRTSQVLALVGILAGCWMSVDHFNRPLTERQYVTGALLLFVSAQILEGVNMGLLSKVMPKVMSRGLWNSGFLSTEAGTFGRVMGAGMITLFGSISSNEANIQRSIMMSALVLLLMTLAVTSWKWTKLVPMSQKMAGDPIAELLETIGEPALSPLDISMRYSIMSVRMDSIHDEECQLQMSDV